MSNRVKAYYRSLLRRPAFEPVDHPIGDLSEAYAREVFACSENGRAFASNVADGAKTLVTIGVTPTGSPHVGTLGQLLQAIRFQRAGFDVQVVIADLAAYNAAGRELAVVRERARWYEAFVRALGFDADAGILRTQEAALDVLHTAQLLSRYYGATDESPDQSEDTEPTAFEIDLQAAYEAVDTPGAETTEFADQQVGLLLVADSLHPVIEAGYENVALVVGADNAGMVGHFEAVLDRSPWEATVAGFYTRLVEGLDGVPKLSKSIPRSRFTLDDDPETIRGHVLDPANDADRPADSMVLQMMRLASPVDETDLERLAADCASGGESWDDAKRDFADWVLACAETWTDARAGTT